jgi:hypothetical protein
MDVFSRRRVEAWVDSKLWNESNGIHRQFAQTPDFFLSRQSLKTSGLVFYKIIN